MEKKLASYWPLIGKESPMKRFIPIIASIFIFTCATMQSIPLEDRSRIFTTSYDQAFSATSSFLSEKGFTFKTINKEDGLIDTDYKQGSALAAFFIGDKRSKVNVFFYRVDENNTKIALTLVTEQKDVFRGWQAESVTKSEALKFYDVYFTEIENRCVNNNAISIQDPPKENVIALFDEPKIILLDIEKIIQGYALIINKENLNFQTGNEFEIVREENIIGVSEVVQIDGEKIAFKIILTDKNDTIKLTDKIKYKK